MTAYFFCAAWVVVHWVMGLTVVYTPDSWGYINFNATRTVGYPLFLSFIKSITGGFDWLPHIQLGLLWASVAYVAHGLSPYLRWPWVLGMAAISVVMKHCYCLEIMTEPLFITTLLVCAGCMLHRVSIVWISLCVGVLILIRPSGYALLPALIVYAWHQRQSWLKMAGPILVCLFVGVGVQAHRNGVWSTHSFLGHNLIGKVAFTVRNGMGSSVPDRDVFIKRMAAYMEPIRKEVDQASSGPIKYFLAAPVYDIIRFKKLASFEEKLNIDPLQHDAFWRDMALEIIQQNPVGYLQDVWMNWQALWLIWDLLPEKQRIVRAQQAEALHQKCNDITFERLEHKTRWPIFVYGMRAGVGIVLLVSLWSLLGTGWWCRRSHPHTSIVMCTLSLLVHGPLMLTACVQAGLPRYALVFWPYFWLLMLLWMEAYYDRYRRYHSVL